MKKASTPPRLKPFSIPKTGSQSAKEFYDSWGAINRLLNFVVLLAGRSYESRKIAQKALIDVERDELKKKEMEARWTGERTAIDELKENRQLLIETILVRHIENFTNYLSKILYEIFLARPETLKSSDKVEISKVLEHSSIESLIIELAEMKVDSLSYSSMVKMSDFFDERFGIKIANDADLKLIAKYIEIRNISVHNRCYINKRYIFRVGLGEELLGRKKELYSGDLDIIVPKLIAVVKSLDEAIRRKMKVKTIRFTRSAAAEEAT